MRDIWRDRWNTIQVQFQPTRNALLVFQRKKTEIRKLIDYWLTYGQLLVTNGLKKFVTSDFGFSADLYALYKFSDESDTPHVVG